MKASDWISVKDRLPKLGEHIIVCCERDNEQWVDSGSLEQGEKGLMWYDTHHDLMFGMVTHWQKVVYPK